MEQPAFQSPYFRLETLAPGVYAAIDTDNDHAAANAGLIDLGGQTVAFDTFVHPAGGAALKAAADALGLGPVTWVINSHFHGDQYSDPH